MPLEVPIKTPCLRTYGEFLEFGILTKGEGPLSRLEGYLLLERPALLLGPRKLVDLRIGAFTAINTHTSIYPADIGRYGAIGEMTSIGGPSPYLQRDDPDLRPLTATKCWPQAVAGTEFEPALGRDAVNFECRGKVPRTRIGHDVWIAAHVVIRQGVTIGDGAIVAAGAVVDQDIPPYSVVVGSPGRVLRPRFPDALVERLQRFQWWQYDLAPHKDDLDFSEPDQALDRLEELLAAGRLQPLRPEIYRLTPEAGGGCLLEPLPVWPEA